MLIKKHRTALIQNSFRTLNHSDNIKRDDPNIKVKIMVWYSYDFNQPYFHQ